MVDINLCANKATIIKQKANTLINTAEIYFWGVFSCLFPSPSHPLSFPPLRGPSNPAKGFVEHC